MIKKNIITRHNIPYILLAPTIIIFAVFMVYPVFRSLYLSFYEYRGGNYPSNSRRINGSSSNERSIVFSNIILYHHSHY